jgi:hypothetical protein
MAIHAFLFITGPCIKHGPVSQHGTAFIRDIQDVSVAFLALIVGKRCIGFLAVLFVVVFILRKMHKDILDAVKGLGIKELKGFMGCRQMTIHTVGHKTLGIIYVGGRFPGIDGESYFVAGCTETGSRSPIHGVIEHAEDWESDHNSDADQYGWFNNLFPVGHFTIRGTRRFSLVHVPSSVGGFSKMGEDATGIIVLNFFKQV